jgi:cytochrome c oxidase assembly protein subunit 15
VHIIHRFLALLSAISIFLVVIYYKDIIKYRIFDILRNILMIIIILQILMGAIVIFTELNLYIAMLHQSLAVILFMVLSFLYWFTLQINYKKH